MSSVEEELERMVAWHKAQVKEARQPAADALDELNRATASYEELHGLARLSLTSPLGCLICAVTFFLLSWACARELGLFEYINVRLLSIQIVRGGVDNATFWCLMWPFSILLSWMLVPAFRSYEAFDVERKSWVGLTGTFTGLQAFGVYICFCGVFDRAQDPSREILESFGQDFGVVMLLLALLQILLFCVSNKRAAEVKAAKDQLEAARRNYCENSASLVGSYQSYVLYKKALDALREKRRQEEAERERQRQERARREAEESRKRAEEKRQAEEEARRKAKERRRSEEARRQREHRESYFAERLGERASAANAMRAHWQTNRNVHERKAAYDGLFRLFVRLSLTKQELDEYLSYSYRQAA